MADFANVKEFSIGDWLKVISAVSAAAAVGYGTGGYLAAVLNAVGALGTLLVTPPGKTSYPK